MDVHEVHPSQPSPESEPSRRPSGVYCRLARDARYAMDAPAPVRLYRGLLTPTDTGIDLPHAGATVPTNPTYLLITSFHAQPVDILLHASAPLPCDLLHTRMSARHVLPTYLFRMPPP